MSRAEPTETLEERIDFLCKFTKGTMQLGCVVRDEAEKARAIEILKGKRHAKLISVQTIDEFNKDAFTKLERF